MAASMRHMSHMSQKNKFQKQPSHGKDMSSKPDGRVGRLDEHTLGYYRRVADTLKDGFQDDNEQDLFLENVFSQMENEQVKLCQNQTVSRILEEILVRARPSQLGKFLDGVLGDFEVVVKDRFAGHVVQKALLQTVPVLDGGVEGADLQEKVLFMAEQLLNSLDSVMTDTYGSHILGTMIQVLGGVRVPDQFARSKLSRDQQNKGASKQTELLLKNVPERMQLCLKKIANSILSAENFKDYLLHRTSSPLLEVLLLVLHRSHPSLCHRLCQAILKRSKVMTKSPDEADERIPVVLTDSIGSHLFEVIIDVTSSESFPDVYNLCFKGHLLKMALHPHANFIVQRLIRRAVKTEEFSDIFDTLSANIEAVLGANHMGVVLRLAEACVHHPTKQRPFLQSLLSAFHCWDPKDRQSTCVLLLAGMVTHEVYFPEKSSEAEGDQEEAKKLTEVNLHGSLLIQQLLKFSHCGAVIAGFMALTDDDLVTVACSPSGSYLLEAFVTSGTVSEKKKERFASKLTANCFKIACHKTGSRSIEGVFNATSIKTKSALAQALAEKDKQLQSDHFGKFVYRNCGVGLFKHRPRDWEELQARESKKRKLFAEIIGVKDETSTAKKKKKQKKKSEEAYSEEMAALGMVDEDGEDGESDKDDDIDEIFGKMSHSTIVVDPPNKEDNTEMLERDAVSGEAKDAKTSKKKRKKDKTSERIPPSDDRELVQLKETSKKHKKHKRKSSASKD